MHVSYEESFTLVLVIGAKLRLSAMTDDVDGMVGGLGEPDKPSQVYDVDEI